MIGVFAKTREVESTKSTVDGKEAIQKVSRLSLQTHAKASATWVWT